MVQGADSDVLPSAQEVMEKIALAEAEKASAQTGRGRSREESSAR
jgi:hypothetical protein